MAKRKAAADDTAPKTHQEDPLLTMSEVARRIGKHPSTIRRWVDDGLLTAVRLPSGLPAVRESQILQLMDVAKF